MAEHPQPPEPASGSPEDQKPAGKKPPGKAPPRKSPAKETKNEPPTKGKRPKHLERAPPDERRCQLKVTSKGGRTTRCTLYRGKYADGSRRPYCFNHSGHEPPPPPPPDTSKLLTEYDELVLRTAKGTAEERRTLLLESDQKLLADALAMTATPREKFIKFLDKKDQMILERAYKAIFDPKNPPKTQDDILAAMSKAAERLDSGTLTPGEANAMGKLLQQISDHIEQFGGEEGSEGGSKVLRLLPGLTLVQKWDLADQPLRYEELQLIVSGVEFDLENGVEPPKAMESQIVRYLGKPRAARMEYDDKQDPEGLRFYTATGEVKISFAELKVRALKRWTRLLKEGVPEVVDDGELPMLPG